MSPVSGVSVLSETALEDYIPGEVFNIAVSAGWIEPQEVPEKKGWPLGDYIVENEQGDWFMNLLAPSLSRLRERAAEGTEEVQQLVSDRYNSAMDLMLNAMANRDAASSEATSIKRGLAKEKIDEYIRLSEEVFEISEFVLQKVAPVARRYKRGVSYASVRRIYLGHTVSASIRQIVAEALSELVPCSRDNLLPADESGADKPETT